MKNIIVIFLVSLCCLSYGKQNRNDALAIISNFISEVNGADNYTNRDKSRNNTISKSQDGFAFVNTWLSNAMDMGLKGYNQDKSLAKGIRRETISSVKISADGDTIAYLVNENKKQCIYVANTQDISGKKGFSSSKKIEEKYSIKDICFWGNKLLYSYFDKKNNSLIVHVYDGDQVIQLGLPNNVQSIRLLNCTNDCLLEVYTGKSYVLYKVSEKRFTAKKLQTQNTPFKSAYNNRLDYPIIVDDKGVVYLTKYNVQDQDSNLNNVIFFAKDENNGKVAYYKVEHNKNKLVLSKYNSSKNAWKSVYKLPIFSNICEYKINIDMDGTPSFFSEYNKTNDMYRHYTWDEDVENHIDILNKKYKSWFRIDTTLDGDVWIICVDDVDEPDNIILYDLDTKRIRNITPDNFSSQGFILR